MSDLFDVKQQGHHQYQTVEEEISNKIQVVSRLHSQSHCLLVEARFHTRKLGQHLLALSWMGIFGLSLEFWLFGRPKCHSQDSSKFGEKNFCNYQLLMLCARATIMSAILSWFSLSWFGSEAYYLKMAECCTHVSWRLARKIVAGKNRLTKFHRCDSCKPRIGLHEKTCLLLERFVTRS